MRILLLAAILLLVTNAHAKPFYANWKWWLGEAAIGGAISLDLYSTARVIQVCPGCGETGIFYAEHPSTAGLVRGGLLDFGIETAIHLGAYNISQEIDSTPWQIVGYSAWPAEAWIAHGLYAARHNFKIVAGCTAAPEVC